MPSALVNDPMLFSDLFFSAGVPTQVVTSVVDAPVEAGRAGDNLSTVRTFALMRFEGKFGGPRGHRSSLPCAEAVGAAHVD